MHLFWRVVFWVIEFSVIGIGIYWLAGGGGPEALITILGGFSAFIVHFAIERYAHRQDKNTESQPTHDNNLLKELQELMNPSTRHFLRRHDHSRPIESNQLDRLVEFIHTWGDVDHEFVNPELEQLRKELHERAREYNHLVSYKTFMDENNRHALDPSLRETNYQKWYGTVEQLNRSAMDVIDAFEELIRTGRQTQA